MMGLPVCHDGVDRRKKGVIVLQPSLRSGDVRSSGVRIDGERLCFSSSVALVDRLFHVQWNGRFFVSNSLIQMLARTGARLNPHLNYCTESFASGCGIKRYPNEFQVLHPEFGISGVSLQSDRRRR